MESDTRALANANEAAANKELGELRADTLRGLKYALENEGVAGVINLLRESETLTPVFDKFADGWRSEQQICLSKEHGHTMTTLRADCPL